MKFYAFHGVLEQERKVGNIFIVDLILHLDLSQASITDNLSDTVNYASVYEIINREMNIPSNLLEHIAGRILKRIKENFPCIDNIEISISKLNPPLGGDIESATVTLKE